jgi:hypothetical protein
MKAHYGWYMADGLVLGVGRNWRFFAEGWQYDPSVGLVFYIRPRSQSHFIRCVL